MIKNFFLSALISAGLLCCNADASLMITIDDGTGAKVVVDGGAGDLDGMVNGNIVANNAFFGFSGFSTLVITATSNAPGPDGFALLNSTNLEATTNSAKTLMLSVFDDMFSGPGAGVAYSVFNSLTGNSGTPKGSMASQSTLLDGASTSAANITINAAGPITDTSSAFIVRTGDPFYSLETRVGYSLAAGSNISFTHVSSALVPEPGTLAIWTVLGGLGLVGVSRRRRS